MAQIFEPRHRSLPLHRVRHVEHQQVVLARSPARLVPSLVNECQVVRGLPVAQYHRVEPVVILELREDIEPEAVTVEREVPGEIIGRADDTEMRSSQIGGLVHQMAP